MGSPSPGTKRPLRLPHVTRWLAQQDPVEGWQAAVRARLRRAESTALRPALELDLGFSFVLFACLVGSAAGVAGAAEVLIVAACVALTPELVLAGWARTLGRACRISLSIRGAETEIAGPALGPRAGIEGEVAGALTNLLFGFGALLAAEYTTRANHLLHQLFVAHATWALAQLLPFVPFRIGSALARRLSARHRRWHAIVSAFITVNLTVWTLELARSPACFVLLACASFAALKAAREAFAEIRDQRTGAEGRAAGARAVLLAGNPQRAAARARSALEMARSSTLLRELWTTLAWAGIAERNAFLAHTALLRLPMDAIDVYLLASYLNACNRNDEALVLLQDARRSGHRSAETSKLLIDLLVARGDQAEARSVAQSDSGLLTLEERQALDAALAW